MRTRLGSIVAGTALVVGLAVAAPGSPVGAEPAVAGAGSTGQVARSTTVTAPTPPAPSAIPDAMSLGGTAASGNADSHDRARAVPVISGVPGSAAAHASGAAGTDPSAVAVSAPPPAAPRTTTGKKGSPESWLPATPKLWPQVVSASQSAPQTVTRGVTRTQEHFETVSGAQRAQVLDVNLKSPNVRLGAVEAGNHIIDPSDETISSMAKRTGAVAGVNADFFAIHASGAPEGMVIRNGALESSPVASWPDDLVVLNNGRVHIGSETFTGTVDDTTQSSSQPLGDINRLGLSATTDLTLVTPAMGATTLGSSVVATATEVKGSTANSPTLVINSVASGVTSIPTLAAPSQDLVASTGTAAAAWLTGTVKPGDRIAVSESLSPYPLKGQSSASTPYVTTAVSGGANLLDNGKLGVPLQGSGENNVSYPVVGLGVTKNGNHAIMAVFDGEEAEDQAVGLTRPQFAEWFAQHGAYNAIEFDSGGSAEMVGRTAGARSVSVLNVPSDGQERDVANGLFIYSTESKAKAATAAQVNAGKALTMLDGTTVSVPVSATDAAGNPATRTPTLSVVPKSAARVVGATTASNGAHYALIKAASTAARGRLVVRDGQARATVDLRVVTHLSSLSVSPSQPDIGSGGTQAFTVSGRVGGATVPVPADSVTWTATPSALGTISTAGVYTAAASGVGLATVKGVAGGATATTTIAVGTTSQSVDTMTDVSKWTVSGTEGSTGTLSESTAAPSGFGGSMDVHYNIPGGSGVKQVVFNPSTVTDNVGELNGNQVPTAVGIWIKGGSAPAGTALANGVLTLAENFDQSGNASTETFYPTGLDFDGWTFVETQLPAGLQYPLSLGFMDILVIDPASTLTGDVELAGLQALYSPRPVVNPPYVPIPRSPKWLQYKQSPNDFTKGGRTVMSFDDAHLVSTDPGSTAAVDLKAIASQVKTLPARARPNAIQTQGDMVDTGTLANLDFLKQTMTQFGVPYHLAVGNHEITQGANPENVNFASVFGATHYAWTAGHAQLIVADSSHIGITASDPYQVPARDQYPWIVNQLSTTKTKDVVLVTHVPAYDPHVVKNSQFADRYEAQMYELLAHKFQVSHPGVHLILLFGHARGFADQLLNQYGDQVPNGIPNLTVADVGVPAYAPADQGGFYYYALFHFLPDGTVQFLVQPILKSLTIDTPQTTTLGVGDREHITATGTSYADDDLAAIKVGIANPASHTWTSTNPSVASVNPVTGSVTAKRVGRVTIRVESGTLHASLRLTVTG